MRVLILGGNGMLGHKVYQVFDPVFDTWTTVRGNEERLNILPFVNPKKVKGHVDAERFDTIRDTVHAIEPDVVVNCVGIVKQLKDAENPSVAIAMNALFPHLLHDLCRDAGIKLIHISTDCVFSGRKGSYTENDQPDAYDLYGRSKLLGEVATGNGLTLRTSMIGRELDKSVGIVEWFLGQQGKKIQGYRRAIFTGFTTRALACTVRDVILNHPDLTGLYHVSSDPINKFDLLCLIRRILRIDVEIEPYDDFFCDRSLDSSLFRSIAGFQPPSWEAMIEELAREAPDYEDWRKAFSGLADSR